MGGLGGAEFLILLVILVLLFGPTLIAFWLGFTLGKKRASASEKPPAPAAAAAPPTTPSAPPETEIPTSDEEPHDD